MGKIIKVSQPATISTTLTPLTDNFYIEPSDTLKQWYQESAAIPYSPNRKSTPLLLTPNLSAFDTDSSSVLYPTFEAWWYYFDANDESQPSDHSADAFWPGHGWIRITNTSSENDPDFIRNGVNLIVRKNVQPNSSTSSGCTLCCVAIYADPRDMAVTYTVQDTVLLATNHETSADSITISIDAPAAAVFNPLVNNSTYTFTASARGNDGEDITSNLIFQWYAKVNGGMIEVLIQTLDCYTQATQETGKGQGTDTITIDMMYVGQIDIICKAKVSANDPFLPNVAQGNITWKYPDVDVKTTCIDGNGVDTKNRAMVFKNIVNTNQKNLSDAEIAQHFQFNWKMRNPTSSVFTDMGWGPTMSTMSNVLRDTTVYTKNVQSDVYMLGPYERVTYGGADITYNNTQVYQRS